RVAERVGAVAALLGPVGRCALLLGRLRGVWVDGERGGDAAAGGFVGDGRAVGAGLVAYAGPLPDDGAVASDGAPVEVAERVVAAVGAAGGHLVAPAGGEAAAGAAEGAA